MGFVKSIKHQVLVLMVSLTLGLTLVLSALAVTTAFIVEDMLMDNWLREQVRLIEDHDAPNVKAITSSFEFLEVYPDLDALPDWVREHIAPEKVSGEIFMPGKAHYHYHQLNFADGRRGYLLAEVSRLLVVTRKPGIFATFLLVFAVFIVLAVWLAVSFSRRLVNPVLALTDAISAREKSATKARLPRLPHELGYLSQTLQASFDNLHDTLERERSFSTDVSHELRTPLTVLTNTSALIAQRGYKADDLPAIRESCQRMENTINVLLALARAESLVLEKCNLKMALEQAILRSKIAAIPDVVVHLEIADDLTVSANPRLLELLFLNLLHNFSEHTRDPFLSVVFANNHLVFENNSEVAVDNDVTRAGVKGLASSGIGQGLYLVSRIAEHFGWVLSVESGEEKFRVCLKLQ